MLPTSSYNPCSSYTPAHIDDIRTIGRNRGNVDGEPEPFKLNSAAKFKTAALAAAGAGAIAVGILVAVGTLGGGLIVYGPLIAGGALLLLGAIAHHKSAVADVKIQNLEFKLGHAVIRAEHAESRKNDEDTDQQVSELQDRIVGLNNQLIRLDFAFNELHVQNQKLKEHLRITGSAHDSGADRDLPAVADPDQFVVHPYSSDDETEDGIEIPTYEEANGIPAEYPPSTTQTMSITASENQMP
jgi:hypothetical protein